MFLTISSIIAIPGSYFWGWLDSKVETKLASAIYSVFYIVALIILVVASSQVLSREREAGVADSTDNG